MQLTEDLKPEAVSYVYVFRCTWFSVVQLVTPFILLCIQVDQENSEHCYDNDKISHNDSDSDCQSCFEDPADKVKLG